MQGTYLENSFSVAGDKGGVVNVVEFCIVLRPLDRVGADFHALHFCKRVGQRDGKETRATVGVDEIALQPVLLRTQLSFHVVDQRFEDAVVVLEERASVELKVFANDTLAHGLAVLGDADGLVFILVSRGGWGQAVSQQQSGTPLEGVDFAVQHTLASALKTFISLSALVNILALHFELLIDSWGSNGTLFNVKDFLAAFDFKANGEPLLLLLERELGRLSFEMRGELGAVSELIR